MNSEDIFNIQDIQDIVNEYAWQLEHQERFKKTLDIIKSMKRRYVIIDSLYGDQRGEYAGFIEYHFHDEGDEYLRAYDFRITYNELTNIVFHIAYEDELNSEYESDEISDDYGEYDIVSDNDIVMTYE